MIIHICEEKIRGKNNTNTHWGMIWNRVLSCAVSLNKLVNEITLNIGIDMPEHCRPRSDAAEFGI